MSLVSFALVSFTFLSFMTLTFFEDSGPVILQNVPDLDFSECLSGHLVVFHSSVVFSSVNALWLILGCGHSFWGSSNKWYLVPRNLQHQ